MTTIALERGLIVPGGDGTSVISTRPLASSARGRTSRRANAGGAGTSVDRVTFVNVPSFVLHGGLRGRGRAAEGAADVAFGGAFYAIVDSEAVGLPIDAAHLPELRRAGMAISRAIEAVQTIAHPIEAGLRGLAGTIFTAPPERRALGAEKRRDFLRRRSGAIAWRHGNGRGDGGRGRDGPDRPETPFVHESLIGTRFTGRIAARTTVGEYPAIVPEIEGAAWITGEHTFLIDEDDPLKEGFRI